MFARYATFLSALSVATAWPIFFYEGKDCNHYPVMTLEHPPPPNSCLFLGRADVQSYSGSTRDPVEKIVLYNDASACYHDAAHRAHANHTITNNSTNCRSFPGVPRAYVFIEEILGPIPNTTTASAFDDLGCNALTVQN